MRRGPRIGLVREASILLPLVLLVLVLVATVTLSAYRSALDDVAATFATGSGTAGAAVANGETLREVARQQRLAARLTWVVIPVNVGLVLFVLFYLRHLVTPFETLLDRARGVAPIEETTARDDVDYLVSTFERAIASLASGNDESDEQEIAALQRALGSSLDSGVLLMDDDDRVLALNPVGCELLELAPPGDERPAVADYCARHPQLVALLESDSSEAASDGAGVTRRELRLERTGDEALTLGLTTHRLRRDDGTPRGQLALFADLTEARRSADEQQRATSLAQLGRMSAGLAHELRNSLAALKGYLTLIDRHPDGDSIHDYLGEIRAESDHLQRVVEDFLSFARPEARLETFVLAELAARLAGDPALGTPAVRLDDRLEPGLRVRADRQLLGRALRNLLRNAAQAHQEAGITGSSPELTLVRSPQQIRIEIADRGAGLPPEGAGALFEPFTTSRPEGVGLGLPLAQRILELHGGSLSLTAREGGGTVAVAELPADIVVT